MGLDSAATQWSHGNNTLCVPGHCVPQTLIFVDYLGRVSGVSPSPLQRKVPMLSVPLLGMPSTTTIGSLAILECRAIMRPLHRARRHTPRDRHVTHTTKFQRVARF